MILIGAHYITLLFIALYSCCRSRSLAPAAPPTSITSKREYEFRLHTKTEKFWLVFCLSSYFSVLIMAVYMFILRLHNVKSFLSKAGLVPL